MTTIVHSFVAAYIPPVRKIPESTPMWTVALYGFGCIVTLVLMYALMRKVRRDKLRRRKPDRDEDVA